MHAPTSGQNPSAVARAGYRGYRCLPLDFLRRADYSCCPGATDAFSGRFASTVVEEVALSSGEGNRDTINIDAGSPFWCFLRKAGHASQVKLRPKRNANNEQAPLVLEAKQPDSRGNLVASQFPPPSRPSFGPQFPSRRPVSVPISKENSSRPSFRPLQVGRH
jgi:hypothetical protein